jgi:cysteine desulfuration protein SufE
MRDLEDIYEEFALVRDLDRDSKWHFFIDLGKALEPMEAALKNAQTKVRGCLADVWLYPLPSGNSQRLHFLADSNAEITKGIVALVIAAVQDKPAAEVAAMDVAAALAPFDLKNQLSSNRTQGVPNMIALVQAHARRFAGK